jgi:integral membrane sensor domain MASE1
MWPAVVAGSFAVEFFIAKQGIATAALLAIGSTTEALVGAWLWQTVRTRWPGKFGSDIGAAVAALVAPLTSATVGATVLLAIERVSVPGTRLWLTWWMGDVVGALFVLPLLLVGPDLIRRARQRSARDAAKVGVVLVVTMVVSWVCFWVEHRGAFLFAVFPALLLAVALFGAPGGRIAALLFALAGIGGELGGRGIFGGGSITSNFLNLQFFLAAVALVALALPWFGSGRRLQLPAIVLVVGWTLSGWIFWTLHEMNDQRDAELFERRVASAQANVALRMSAYVDALRSAVAFYAASPSVTREQ